MQCLDASCTWFSIPLGKKTFSDTLHRNQLIVTGAHCNERTMLLVEPHDR